MIGIRIGDQEFLKNIILQDTGYQEAKVKALEFIKDEKILMEIILQSNDANINARAKCIVRKLREEEELDNY
jgi:hypothetical protein